MKIGLILFIMSVLIGSCICALTFYRDPQYENHEFIYLIEFLIVIHMVIVRYFFGHVAFAKGSEVVRENIDCVFGLMISLSSASFVWRSEFTFNFADIGYTLPDIVTWIGTFSTLLFVMFQTASNYALEQSRSELGIRTEVASRVILLLQQLHKLEEKWSTSHTVSEVKRESNGLMDGIQTLLFSIVSPDSAAAIALAEAQKEINSWPDQFDSKVEVSNNVREARRIFHQFQLSLLTGLR